MTLADILLLAVVQALTEFLPVSSSGHLVIVESMLAGDDLPLASASTLAINVVLHFGTLLAVLLVFRKRLVEIARRQPRVLWLTLLGCVPAAAVGLPLKYYGTGLLANADLAAVMLIVTGLVLLALGRRSGPTQLAELSPRQALLIGIAQALAILPGVSRSGLTIVAALALGLRRDAAATFSFLLAIPVIGGAMLLESFELAGQSLPGVSMATLAAGAAVAFVVGLGALYLLLRMVDRGKLHYFGWYCLPVGAACLMWRNLF